MYNFTVECCTSLGSPVIESFFGCIVSDGFVLIRHCFCFGVVLGLYLVLSFHFENSTSLRHQ